MNTIQVVAYGQMGGAVFVDGKQVALCYQWETPQNEVILRTTAVFVGEKGWPFPAAQDGNRLASIADWIRRNPRQFEVLQRNSKIETLEAIRAVGRALAEQR